MPLLEILKIFKFIKEICKPVFSGLALHEMPLRKPALDRLVFSKIFFKRPVLSKAVFNRPVLNKPFFYKMFSVLALICLLSITSIFIAACNDLNISANTGTFDDAIDKNTLIAGSDTTFPPFSFIENGQAKGFDIDIITEVVKRLGKELEIRTIKWDLEFKELADGNLDVIISTVCYDEGKESLVDFSQPYFNMKFLLIYLAGSVTMVNEDLTDKNVGILDSSRDCLEKPYLASFKLVYFKDVIEMIEALKNKEIEAMFLNIPIAVNLIRENKDMYSVLEEVDSLRDYVMVFRKASSLKPAIDAALEKMRIDGTYNEIYSKWFAYK